MENQRASSRRLLIATLCVIALTQCTGHKASGVIEQFCTAADAYDLAQLKKLSAPNTFYLLDRSLPSRDQPSPLLFKAAAKGIREIVAAPLRVVHNDNGVAYIGFATIPHNTQQRLNFVSVGENVYLTKVAGYPPEKLDSSVVAPEEWTVCYLIDESFGVDPAKRAEVQRVLDAVPERFLTEALIMGNIDAYRDFNDLFMGGNPDPKIATLKEKYK